MPSDAMRVACAVMAAYEDAWEQPTDAMDGMNAAAAVIERAIAEAVEQERAKAEALAEAARGFLKGADAGIVSVAQDKALRAALRAWEE